MLATIREKVTLQPLARSSFGSLMVVDGLLNAGITHGDGLAVSFSEALEDSPTAQAADSDQRSESPE